MKKTEKTKKGFTLIELLAVIAILAAILLIAVPKILDIIDNVKIKAFKESTQLIMGVAEKNYARDLSDDNNIEKEYYYKDGVEYGFTNSELKYSGKKPEDGVIRVGANGVIAMALYDGERCAIKTSSSEEVTVSEVGIDECVTETIINTTDTWAEIALDYGMPLSVLLDYNEVADENSSTSGLDIKIPIFINEISSTNALATNDSKNYYGLGYVEVSGPFSSTTITESITLNNLPIAIEDIPGTNVSVYGVMENNEDFEKYIMKESMGDITYEVADEVYFDINSAETLGDHVLTSSNMTIDSIEVTCTTECVAEITVTVNNIDNATVINKGGKDIIYVPVKFVVEFGDFIPAGYTPIYTIEDLYDINNDVTTDYILMNDLDFSSDASYDNPSASTVDYNGDGTTKTAKEEFTIDVGWLPIVDFAGTFDGDGYTISNLYINRGMYSAFFKKIMAGSLVTNIGLENVYITGSTFTAGIAGYASAEINNSYVTGVIDGGTGTGGIAGYTYDLIENCHTEVTISGDGEVGGIAGSQASTDTGGISKSWSNSTVTGTANSIGGLAGTANYLVENCYSKGSVTGKDYTGGLVGYRMRGNTSKSYSISTVSGGTYVGGLEGYRGPNGVTSYSFSGGDVTATGNTGGVVGANGGSITYNYRLGTAKVKGAITNGTITTIDGQNETAATLQSDAFLSGTAGWDTTTIWQVNASAWPTLR